MRASHRIIILAALLMAAVTGTAQAQTSAPVPPACAATTSASSAYRTGLRLGERTVNSAWDNVRRDCGRVDQFMDIIDSSLTRLTLPAGASLATVCRYAGNIDGAYGALDLLYGTCADQCFLDGEMIGALTGEIYCELSIALGGLVAADEFIRGEVQVCGLNFEIGCDSAFIGTTLEYENTDGVCLPFTEDGFEPVWDQVRNNSCAYEPEPDPLPVSSPDELL
jgi:hypothetical protein